MLWIILFLPLYLFFNLLLPILFSPQQTILFISAQNLEKKMLIKAKQYKLEMSSNFTLRKPLLFVTFLNISNTISTKNLQNNMLKTGKRGDWALIDYSQSPLINRYCRPFFSRNTTVFCKRTSVQRAKMKIIAKPLMYVDFVSLLDDYRYVFLLDEDMSFMDFNLTNYQTLHDCAFIPNPPPMISQPLIAESTQDFDYLNYDAWKNPTLLATETPFIEQQVPYFNTVFLKWFIEYVIQPSFPAVRVTESSWGPDNIWCGAAKAFAVEVLGYDPKKYVSCAIIIKGPPIHHLNLQTIKSKKTNRNKFVGSGMKMHNYYRNHFPRWFEWGRNNSKNPLHKHHNYTRSTSLTEKCQLAFEQFVK